MACYGCGAAEGSSVQLCPACIAKRRSARSTEVVENIFKPTGGPDPLTIILQSPLLQLIATIVFYFLLYTYFSHAGPVIRFGPVAAALFAGMVLCSAIGVVTWILFWVKLVVFEPYWALGSLILPALVYRFVLINWHEYKIYFTIHIAAIVASVVIGCILADWLNMEFLEVFSVYQLFTHGHDVELGARY